MNLNHKIYEIIDYEKDLKFPVSGLKFKNADDTDWKDFRGFVLKNLIIFLLFIQLNYFFIIFAKN